MVAYVSWIGLALSTAMPSAQMPAPTARELVGMRSLALSPDGENLAFVWRGDVWVVSTDGGRATPITSNIEMDDNPVWSPDGKWLAFSSNRYGSNDIYVAPVDGGEARRLTWHSGSDVPSSWSKDGRWILMRTTREDPHNGIYAIDVNTGQTKQMFLDMMPIGSPEMSPDGKEVLYQRHAGFSWLRPRYQGSGAAQLWRFDVATNKRTKLRDNGQQHLWPHFSPDGKTVFCVTVSEKTPSTTTIGKSIGKNVDNVERTPNVYKVTLDGRASRLTNFVGFAGTRFLTVGGDYVAFEQDGSAHIMRPGEAPKRISITANIDDKTAMEERLVITTGMEDGSLSPKGDRVAFTVRGELWLVPVKKGKGPNADDATQLTDYAGIDGGPIWHPDGNHIFFVSDRNGAERIFRMNVETKEVTPWVRDDYDQSELRISADKRFLTYWLAGPQGGLFRVSVSGGTPERLLDRPWLGGYAFSPDGRYLAYSQLTPNTGFKPWDNASNLWVKDLVSGKTQAVTELNATHSNPVWSADGKYLYFRTSRDGGAIYALPMTAEIARTTELDLKFEKPKEPVKVEMDWVDTELRLRRVVNSPAGFGAPIADPNTGDLYYMNGGDIFTVNYAGENVRPITSGGGISGLELSDDGNSLVFMRGGTMNVLNLRAPNFPTAAVTFRADWLRDVSGERQAAYQQFWRIYNRTFYDSNFHGRDWVAVRERYRKFLDSVGHRNEMATVINMLTGELEASHAEVSPGPGNPSGASTAHPGFFIDYSHTGPGLKIKEVPARTPGTFAKTKLEAGEVVLSINGQKVTANEQSLKVFADQSGREMKFEVHGKDGKVRTVTYRALSGGEMQGIVYRNRIDSRRKYVEEKSGGKLTYVHIAGMGGGNLDAFNLQAWQYIQGKQGVVIDVRNNGGGNIADLLLDMIERKPNMRYQLRDGDAILGPGTVWDRATVVMHAETSFSNAEMFPAAMKSAGLAKLVGMPTPGYVIYTSGTRLVDGTSIRLPGTGVFRLDGSPTENLGQEPDYKVDITPEEYFAGKDPQLDKAIDVLLKSLGK